jgi:hypothetical protein
MSAARFEGEDHRVEQLDANVSLFRAAGVDSEMLQIDAGLSGLFQTEP